MCLINLLCFDKMTPYDSVNVKLCNSQLNKLKSATKNETEMMVRLPSDMIGNSNDEASFPHKLFLADRIVANLHKTFANNFSGNIKLSKTDPSKTIQSGRFLGRLLGPLMKVGLSLVKNVLPPLGLTAAASAADAGIDKTILGLEQQC